MNNKYIYLAAAIMALLVFLGFLVETEPQQFFGYPINIWVYRIIWLLLSISFSFSYFKRRRAEKE